MVLRRWEVFVGTRGGTLPDHSMSRAALPATARQSLMRLWREAPPPAGPCWTPLQAEGVHVGAT